MRIGVTTLGCDAGKSGIGKYVIALLKKLPALAPDDTFVVAVLENERDVYPCDAPNVEVVVLPSELGSVRKSLLWHALSLPAWAREQRLDVLFLPAGNRRLPWSAPCPTIGTVHDLSSFHVAAKYDPLRMLYIKQVLPRMIRRLTRVLTVSESSLRDIEKYAHVPGAKIAITPNGYDPENFHMGLPRGVETAARYTHSQKPYWIYVSRIEHPGKNHIGVIEAYETLLRENPDIPDLVCAGGDWDGSADVHARHEKSPAKDRIHFTGFVANEDLPPLVAGAEACVYPSLYEGFGIPVIEAMACGVPVACSNTSSLPEVAGDAALLFDPHDAKQIAGALKVLSSDEGRRQDLIEKGRKRAALFTWQACAEMTIDEIRRAAKEGKR